MIALALILSAFAIYGVVLCGVWWFITSCNSDIAESNADRAYRWREQMREMSRR